MKSKKKNKKKLVSILVCGIVLMMGIFLVLKMVGLENLKEKALEVFANQTMGDSYHAKALVLVDLSNDENFIYKKVEEKLIPASLAKLFVIEYASTLTNLDDVVFANADAIAMVKEGSSVANIKEKQYSIENLFAAMLVPSGNDAAYVLADYCGGILSSKATTSQERVKVFMEHLNGYLRKQGYDHTKLYDPSGFDIQAYTTVLDLKEVVKKLIQHQWFRNIVSKSTYIATLPDGSTQTWKNTNVFLDATSKYYNENIKGIKTGSLADDYNLVVLYQMYGKEFLICSLGSCSDDARYQDVNYIIQTINESDYLKENHH